MSNDFEDIAVTRTSQMSGIRRTQTFRMRYDDYIRWQDGELIQEALPYLTPDQREFLMTGITAEEWDDLFGEPPTESTKPINGQLPNIGSNALPEDNDNGS